MLALFLTFAIHSVAGAASVTLAWDPTGASTDSYSLFLRSAGQSYNYDAPAWKGPSTQCTIDQVENGKTYFAVVRACEGNDVSGDSNELQFTVPTATPTTTTDQGSSDVGESTQTESTGTSETQSGTYADIVVDDGDAGAVAKGKWSESNAAGAYGIRSLFSRDTTATYTFKAQIAGSYEVALWWTQLSSRCTKVPVKIYDGTSLLKTVYVNQRIDGGQWNVVGTYQFSDYPRVVITVTGKGSTCADAVEFMADDSASDEVVKDNTGTAGNTGGSDVEELAIDDGDAGAVAKGKWSESNAAGAYGIRSLFSRDTTATYTFKAQIAGSYEVALWWTQLSSRCTKVPVKIYDGTSLLKTVYVNQRIDGGQWNVVGTYQFSDYPRVVITVTGKGSACADAVQFLGDP